MKDIDTPRRMISRGGKALQRYVFAEDRAPGDGLQPGDGLAKLLLAAAGYARHAEDFPGGNGEVDVVKRLDAILIDDGEVMHVQHRRVAQRLGAMNRQIHRRADHALGQFPGAGFAGVHRADAPAAAQNGDAIRNFQNFVEFMGDDDNGAALVAHLAQNCKQAFDLLRG